VDDNTGKNLKNESTDWRGARRASLKCWTTKAPAALLHLRCLRGRLTKHSVEIGPAVLPGHFDCFPHGISHDDELGRPTVLASPKRDDISLNRHGLVQAGVRLAWLLRPALTEPHAIPDRDWLLLFGHPRKEVFSRGLVLKRFAGLWLAVGDCWFRNHSLDLALWRRLFCQCGASH
jgi:hypothetical protein